MPEVLRLPAMIPYYCHRQAPDPITVNLETQSSSSSSSKKKESYGSRIAKQQKCAFDNLEQAYWFGGRDERFRTKRPERFVMLPQLTLENVKLFLVHYHGSLRNAFNAMDFIRNGSISPMEWSESVWGMIRSKRGHDMDQHNFTELPRRQYDIMMNKLFRLIDFDGSGEISFDEFSNAHDEVFHNPHMFTNQRDKEMEEALHATTLADELEEQRRKDHMRSEMGNTRSSKTVSNEELLLRGLSQEEIEIDEDEKNRRAFTAVLLSKYENFDEAFKQLDVNNSGGLSPVEFQTACQRIRFEGEWRPIFQHLDQDKDGEVLKSDFTILVRPPKKAIDAARKASEDFRNYSKFNAEKGTMKPESLLPRHVYFRRNLPHLDKQLGTFSRLPCRRMDTAFQPSELPGTDTMNYSPDLGPGSYILPWDEDFEYGKEKKSKAKLVGRVTKSAGNSPSDDSEPVGSSTTSSRGRPPFNKYF
ncbi:unnamed protein product [Amoebophrya sp. A120]|nr:unnamed protein product [Amoebophrya sp. A120]|eukprot:GSA120T00013937001.1